MYSLQSKIISSFATFQNSLIQLFKICYIAHLWKDQLHVLSISWTSNSLVLFFCALLHLWILLFHTKLFSQIRLPCLPEMSLQTHSLDTQRRKTIMVKFCHRLSINCRLASWSVCLICQRRIIVLSLFYPHIYLAYKLCKQDSLLPPNSQCLAKGSHSRSVLPGATTKPKYTVTSCWLNPNRQNFLSF